MAERTIASVLKTVEPLRVPGVRIPLSPPLAEGRHKAAFSRFPSTEIRGDLDK